MACKAHGLHGDFLRHAVHLEEHTTGLDDAHPVLGRALAAAHAGLGRLRRDRLVGENLDPDLTAALDVTRHGDTGGFDLTIRDPCRLQSHKAELTVADRVAAMCLALHAAAELLAVFDSLR